MSTDDFFVKSVRINSPLRVHGLVRMFSGAILLGSGIFKLPVVESLLTGLLEGEEDRILQFLGPSLAAIIIVITGLVYFFDSLKYLNRLTITPEVPLEFRDYNRISESIQKGKLEIYRLPEFGPLKFAYKYISDKVPFLTPQQRKVVSKNVSFLWKYILMVVIILLVIYLQQFISAGFYEEVDIPLNTFEFPVWMILILLIFLGLGFYTIFLLIPGNIPRQVVKENIATISGGGDPNIFCPLIDKSMLEFRFNDLQNRTYKSGFEKIEELSFNETGSFRGKFALESHPKYLSSSRGSVPYICQGIAVCAVLAAIFCLYHVTPFTENAGSLQGRLGNLAGGIIYLGTASNFFRRSRLLLDTYRFESIFLYVDIEGTIGKSEITAGKAVTDSLETRNIVIRSDSQFRIYTTKILSECLKLNGERYITAMVTDSQVEQATERVMQAISNFRDEGVSIRGIDVSADSLDQITRANAIIQSNKRQQSRISLANQEQKKAIGIRKDAGADFPPQESEADISTTEADTKECPRCAEIIRAKAVYCRFCGFEIGSPAGEHPVNE